MTTTLDRRPSQNGQTVATIDPTVAIEQLVINGDTAKLTPEQRTQFVIDLCDSLGLNWRSKPFEWITLNGKLVPYARKDCTEQLRRLHRIHLTIVSRERMDDCYIVTARATLPDGRMDESIGAVPIGKLAGEALANALMKAETKAKRRVTLSICGLGVLDETELETIRGITNPSYDKQGVPSGGLLEKVKQATADNPLNGHAQNVMDAIGAEGEVVSVTLDTDREMELNDFYTNACADKAYSEDEQMFLLKSHRHFRKDDWMTDPEKAWKAITEKVAKGGFQQAIADYRKQNPA